MCRDSNKSYKDFCPWCAPKICRHPEHKPPRHIVLPPGPHSYTCPGCGQTTTVVVRDRPTLCC